MKTKIIARSFCYTATHTTGKSNSKGLLIAILRNDTFELVNTWRVQQDSMHEIKSMLDNTAPPEDWKQPHRKCLAYYISKKERMERLIYPEKTQNLFKLIKQQEAYTYHTLKKLHELDSEQINMLLSLSASERVTDSVECLSLIHGRIALYHMLFDKRPSYISKFKKMINEVAQLYPDYSFARAPS